jgi:hypothetical protein
MSGGRMLNHIIIFSLLLSFNLATAQSQGVYSSAYTEILNSGWAAPVTYSSGKFPTTCSDEQAKKIFRSIGLFEMIPNPAEKSITKWISARKSKYQDLVESTTIVSESGSRVAGAQENLKNFKEEEKEINRIMYSESIRNCNSNVKAKDEEIVNSINTPVNAANANIPKKNTPSNKMMCGLDGKDSNGKICDTTAIAPIPKTNPVAAESKVTSTTQVGGVTYVKVDKGDGSTVTYVRSNEDNSVINTIETKKNGREVVRDADGNRVQGDAKKEVLADKEIFSPEKEKQKALDTSTQAAENTTKDIEKNKDNPDSIVNKDPKAAANAAAAEKKAAEAVAAIQDKLSTVPTEIKTEYDAAAAVNPQTPESQAKMLACQTALSDYTEVMKDIEAITREEKACNRNESVATFLCPIASNPSVATAATMMNAAAAAIPAVSSAKETCKVTSKINLVGQGLLTAGSAVCLFSKGRCEKKCADANAHLATFQANLVKVQSYKCSETANATITASFDTIKTHTGANTVNIDTCNKYKVDAGQMVATALNMSGAAAQAAQCEKQLASEEGTDNKANTLTMDQMCAKPEQAVTPLCKCRNDNTAVGCPGNIAGNKNEGNLNKDLNAKGAAGMAGLSYGKKITPSGGSSSDTNLDGLSDEAKQALAANADSNTGPMFGAAAGSGGGGGGGTAAGAGTGAAAASEKVKENPKSFGSSFMNAVGSLFGKGSGSSGSGKGAAKTDPFAADKQKEKIKRQIAAEQMRSEISSASGTDNWSKIKSRYKSNVPSLIDSN